MYQRYQIMLTLQWIRQILEAYSENRSSPSTATPPLSRDDPQQKSGIVHPVLDFIIDIIGQQPPIPENPVSPDQALVSV